MFIIIQKWGSPVGIGYELHRGWKQMKDSGCLIFGKDVARTREEATEYMPFAGDVIQAVIDENNILGDINIPHGFEDILSDIKMPEREFMPSKGKAVWFPVENGIKATDWHAVGADPAMGYVKSVDENGVAEIDVRQVYRRTKAPNSIDESRKMQPMDGTAHIDTKYCFEKRMDCMDYIISSFNIVHAKVEKEIQLTDEDLAGLIKTKGVKEMAKDFRNASKLPDDFVIFDFTKNPPRMLDVRKRFGKEDATQLSNLLDGFGFSVNSDMTGIKASIEEAAMKALKETNEGADLTDITIEAVDPYCISFRKGDLEFAELYSDINVNEKYIENGSYPLIPEVMDGAEWLGCGWIEYDNLSWAPFERVETALEENRMMAEEFEAGLESISVSEDILAQ